jgi:hypothetical protein
VTFRARHLHDDRLFDCYLAERHGERLDPPVAEHLADCPTCAGRYGDVARFMDQLHANADADVDAIFPAEQLRAQQQQIARRIEHVGHAARVISFPGHPSAHHLSGGRLRITPRWIAAAAAAGLFIGVYVGTFVDSGAHASRAGHLLPVARSVTQPAPAAPQGALPGRSAVIPPAREVSSPVTDPANAVNGANDVDIDRADSDSNDEFLSELEVALERPHTRELIALDDLTPHARGVQTSFETSSR